MSLLLLFNQVGATGDKNVNVSGVQAIGTAGALSAEVDAFGAQASGTGAAGSLAGEVDAGVVSAVGTGVAGSFSFSGSGSGSLTGASSTGVAGSLSGADTSGISGVGGTGVVNSGNAEVDKPLGQAVGIGVAGSLTSAIVTDCTVNLLGVAGIGRAGIITGIGNVTLATGGGNGGTKKKRRPFASYPDWVRPKIETPEPVEAKVTVEAVLDEPAEVELARITGLDPAKLFGEAPAPRPDARAEAARKADEEDEEAVVTMLLEDHIEREEAVRKIIADMLADIIASIQQELA